MKMTKYVYAIVTGILLVIAGLMVLSVWGVPGNTKLLVVLTGSMEPALKTGSLIWVKPEDSYQINDIVSFKVKPEADINNPKLVVTHRLVDSQIEEGQKYWITKGDANNVEDMERLDPERILGKAVFTVPYLGYPVGFAKTQTGFIVLIVIPATIIIYSELQNIKHEANKLIKERRRRKLSTIEKAEVAVAQEEEKIEKEIKKLTKKK